MWNVNLPTGQITGPQRAFTLQTSGQLTTADQYKSLVVAYRNSTPVRLEELGELKDSVEDDKTASWFYTPQDDQRAIVLAIQRQPGTNTIAVTDSVKSLLPVFEQELPPSVHMDILYDRSETRFATPTRTSKVTMLMTLALVIGVIFLFLRNVSATVIPSLALPFSIVGTFAIMYMLSYSLDNLSMMALILSVGFVVDDAIVMLENIFRHMELGQKPLSAALVGSSEIGFTIVSMTLSLTAVFIPVLFMGGIMGRLFREFSVTICVAILISGLVSVTLTPDAVQPVPARQTRRNIPGSTGCDGGVLRRRHAAGLRTHLADGSPLPARHHGGVRGGSGRNRIPVHQDSRRALFRIRIPTNWR